MMKKTIHTPDSQSFESQLPDSQLPDFDLTATNHNSQELSQALLIAKKVVEHSTHLITYLPSTFYLHEHQQDISELLEELAKYLDSKSSMIHGITHHLKRKTKRTMKKLMGIDDLANTHQTSSSTNINPSVQLLTLLNQHKQALLLENAQLNQTMDELESNNKELQHCLAEIESLITTIDEEKEPKYLSMHSLETNSLEIKSQLLNQSLTLNNAVIALQTAMARNTEVSNSLNHLASNGLSATKVHELAVKLQQ